MKQIKDLEERALESSKDLEQMKLKRDATSDGLMKQIIDLEKRAVESSKEIEEMKVLAEAIKVNETSENFYLSCNPVGEQGLQRKRDATEDTLNVVSDGSTDNLMAQMEDLGRRVKESSNQIHGLKIRLDLEASKRVEISQATLNAVKEDLKTLKIAQPIQALNAVGEEHALNAVEQAP